ncbi:MAG: hypothetical protein ACK5PP_02140 [Acidimicrobiales bacterium]
MDAAVEAVVVDASVEAEVDACSPMVDTVLDEVSSPSELHEASSNAEETTTGIAHQRHETGPDVPPPGRGRAFLRTADIITFSFIEVGAP